MYSILKKTCSAVFGAAVVLTSLSPSVFAEGSYVDFQANNCTITVGKSTCVSTLYIKAPAGKIYTVANLSRAITSGNLVTPYLYSSADGRYTVTTTVLGDAANYFKEGQNSLELREGETVVARAIGTGTCASGSAWNGSMCAATSSVASAGSASSSDTTAAASTLASSANPYRASFTTEYAARIDKVVANILARGKDLSQDRYIVYLSSISEGIKTLVQKPAYQNNSEIRNIADYISYEIDTVKNGLSKGDTFMGDLSVLIDKTLSASNENVKTPTGSTNTTAGSTNAATNTTNTTTSPANTPAGSTNTTSPATSPASDKNISLSIMGLGATVNGYLPVKVGKTLTIDYSVTGVQQCKGIYSKIGGGAGGEIQFRTENSVSNTTYLSRGSFDLQINYPTHVEFTCYGADTKKITETLDFQTKAHDDTDTYIETDKDSVASVGDTVAVSWQVNPAGINESKYCHISKTYSVNGVKGPTSFLDKSVDHAVRNSGTITDTITTPGTYVYVLNCNANSDAYLDNYMGTMVTSRAVTLAGAASAASTSTADAIDYRAEVIAMFAGNPLAHAYAPVPSEDLIAAWTAEIKARGLAGAKAQFPIAVNAYVDGEIRNMYNSNATARLYLPNGPDQASIDYWKPIIIANGPAAVTSTIFPAAVAEYARANPL